MHFDRSDIASLAEIGDFAGSFGSGHYTGQGAFGIQGRGRWGSASQGAFGVQGQGGRWAAIGRSVAQAAHKPKKKKATKKKATKSRFGKDWQAQTALAARRAQAQAKLNAKKRRKLQVRAAHVRLSTPIAIIGAAPPTKFEAQAASPGGYAEGSSLEPSEVLEDVDQQVDAEPVAVSARRAVPVEQDEEEPGEAAPEEPEEEEPAEQEPAEEEESIEGLLEALDMTRDVMVLGELGDVVMPNEGVESGPDPRFATGPVAMAIREPDKAPVGSGWPAAAKLSPDAWARGDGSYIVQRGDSVSGLSQTYLGAYARWREIWSVQTREFLGRHPSPDKIQVGDVMTMPKEAQQNARRLGVLKGGSKKALIIGGALLGVVTVGGIGYGIYSGAIGG